MRTVNFKYEGPKECITKFKKLNFIPPKYEQNYTLLKQYVCNCDDCKLPRQRNYLCAFLLWNVAFIT